MPTHAEYEAVRAYGSHFMISLNHENPENTWVLSENARFAVIDVIAGETAIRSLARNPPRWVDAASTTRPALSEPERSPMTIAHHPCAS